MTRKKHGHGRRHDASAAAFPLGEYVDGFVERLRELVPCAVKDGDIEAIHQARVATRRLKAAFDLVAPVTSDDHRKPLARTLKKLRRKLGPMRDLDVMLAHLGELKGRYRSHASAIGWLIERLKRERGDAGRDATNDIPPAKTLAKLGEWWGVRQELHDARDATTSLVGQSLHEQIEAFARQADQLSKAPSDIESGAPIAVDSSAESSSAEVATPPPAPRADPHEVRIAGKSLRYTLEMAEVAGHPLPRTVMKAFKRMQDELGLWHDYVVLTEAALERSAEEMLAHHDAALQGKILGLAQLTLGKSESHLKRFTELWRKEGASITSAVHAVFPLTSDASGDADRATSPRRDHDPTDSNGSGPPEPAAALPDRPAAF